MKNLEEVFEQLYLYSQSIQKLIESGKSYNRIETAMVNYFIDEVKNKGIEADMLKQYPDLEHLFEGINLKLKTYKRQMRKKRTKND